MNSELMVALLLWVPKQGRGVWAQNRRYALWCWPKGPGRSGLDNCFPGIGAGSILDSGTTKRENMHRGAHTPRTCSLRSLNMGPQGFCLFWGLKNQSRDLERWSWVCLLAPGLVPPCSPPSATPLWGWLLSGALTPFLIQFWFIS